MGDRVGDRLNLLGNLSISTVTVQKQFPNRNTIECTGWLVDGVSVSINLKNLTDAEAAYIRDGLIGQEYEVNIHRVGPNPKIGGEG